MEEGAEWFRRMGTPDSAGTRLLSVAGDCDRAGDLRGRMGHHPRRGARPWSAREDARAVQISGPSGECLRSARTADRRIAYEDIPCNGAVTIFNATRDLLGLSSRTTRSSSLTSPAASVFPAGPAPSICTRRWNSSSAGGRTQSDLDDMVRWGALVRKTSRCGLGATAANPILTTLEKFPEIYRSRLRTQEQALLPSFDLDAALAGYDKAVTELAMDGSRA